MVTLFLKSDEPIHVFYFKNGETINYDKYFESTFEPLVQSIKLARSTFGKKSIKIQHPTKDFLIEQDLTIMEHPPHSSDLGPCDFWLNSYVKDSSEAPSALITAILNSIPNSE